jgi:hypothetical protein
VRESYDVPRQVCCIIAKQPQVKQRAARANQSINEATCSGDLMYARWPWLVWHLGIQNLSRTVDTWKEY